MTYQEGLSKLEQTAFDIAVFDYHLPDGLLQDDDHEVRQLNLDLLDKVGSEGKPLVFVRVNTHAATTKWKPNIFVPVAA
jgi:hypothetical protein